MAQNPDIRDVILEPSEQRRLLKRLNDKYRPQIESANQTHRASAQTLRMIEDAYQRERAYINNLFTGE
jgi:hypothetical protein